jgi:2-succinyl-5-enolpyruvyl-6-hydroxy-3-cyclohexene-1-carboxylate synthase
VLADVAAAYQVGHVLVSTPAQLQAALAAPGGLRIVEVRTDRGENAALHDRLRAAAASAVAALSP